MDYTNPDFWIAIGIGGGVIGILSAAVQASQKNPDTPYRPRAIFRDFFFGAFITATLYMILPESFQTMIAAAQAKVSSGFTSVASAVPEVEIQTGPARF
jgi:hypothetical protein